MLETHSGVKKSKTKLFIIIGAFAFVVVTAVAGYFAWQFFALKNDPNKAGQETATRITGAIGKIYDLPTDEQPTVAQVQDKEKLKDQTFFDKAQNGDFIVIYANKKLALLYREKDAKLINVGPISVTDQNKQAPGTPAATTPVADPAKKR